MTPAPDSPEVVLARLRAEECPACEGRGGELLDDWGYERADCPACGGSGLRAQVAPTGDAMSRHAPHSPTGTTVPLLCRLATLPARAWLCVLLLWHRPPPSVGVLNRLAGARRDRRGSRCGRR